MHPVLGSFSLGGTKVTVTAYSFFYLLAWVAGPLFAAATAHRMGLSWKRPLIAFASGLVAGIAGARALDLVVNWNYYATDPTRSYAFEFRGFALYGGLIAAVVVAAIVVWRLSLPLWRVADAAVPGLAVGIVLMRIGCFLNGCCFGRPTSLPWGVRYPPGSRAWAEVWASQMTSGEAVIPGIHGDVKPVHPTQVYEMLAALGFCGLSLLIGRKLQKRKRAPASEGIAFLVFAVGFTLFRLANHFLRAYPTSPLVPNWFYPCLYGLISLATMVLLGRKIFARTAGRHFRPTLPN